jgi:hypothetical protein
MMKKVKKINSSKRTTNANSSKDALLKWSSQLIVSLMLLLRFANSNAQTFPAPALEWQKSYWPTTHPTLGSQTREQSGEDWFYSTAVSKVSFVQNGWICAGYNTYPEWNFIESTGCLNIPVPNATEFDYGEFETNGHRKGGTVNQISFIDLDGNRLWHKNFLQGEITKIIQTSDGNFLAVGNTMSTRDIFNGNQNLFYNQTANSQTNNYFKTNTDCNGQNTRKACLIKIDPQGNLIWQKLYGMEDFVQGVSVSNELAYASWAYGYDVTEVDGKYYISGKASTLPSITHDKPTYDKNKGITSNFIMKINTDGYLLNKSNLGDNSIVSHGGTLASFKDINGIVKLAVVGESKNISTSLYSSEFYILNDALTTINSFSYNPSPNKTMRNWNIVFNSNGNLLVPLVYDCGDCWGNGYHGKGATNQLSICKFDVSTGNNFTGFPKNLK